MPDLAEPDAERIEPAAIDHAGPDAIPPECRIDAYDYALPSELIAQHPTDRREDARLMVVPRHGTPVDLTFKELGSLLQPHDLLVANDTRVLRARLHPRRKRGGAAEVLLLHPVAGEGAWEAMARPGKRVRKGDRLAFDAACGVEILDWAPGGNRVVRFYGIDADTAMERFGETPLPPYIEHPPPDADARYQTVYARHRGSVAAPTAGLHFTSDLLADLARRGVGWTTLTLHVGAGTFRPVKTHDIRLHHMHAERYEIGEETVVAIRAARNAGGRVIAVGTTTLRALEASAACDGDVTAGSHWTSIFIHPPYRFRVVDALITNFHLPRSTLLMLVAAFAGRERILAAYDHAVRHAYRFYSFGDAMLLTRQAGPDR